MASAGRILIIPKGEWNAETEYEMLDLVFNDGASWVAKKISTGIEPKNDVNEEHWMKMCESVDLTEVYNRLSAIENQMLSTLSLDDIDLSGYATKTDLDGYLKITGGTLKGDLGLNNGNGNIISNEYGTMIRAVKDGHTYRGFKVDNPKFENAFVDCARLVDTVDGVTKEYKLFGEHNQDFLLNLISSSINGVKFQTGTHSRTNVGENLNNIVRFSCDFPAKAIFVLGTPNSTSEWYSITIIIPDKGVGITLSQQGTLVMGDLVATRDGNDTIIQHTRNADKAPIFACNNASCKYDWLAIG